MSLLILLYCIYRHYPTFIKRFCNSAIRLALGSLPLNTRISPSCPLSVTWGDPRPGAYICPAYKSPLPQLLLPTSATQGGIPLPFSSCCLYHCSCLCGISPRLLWRRIRRAPDLSS